MHHAISYYPLSAAFRARIESAGGSVAHWMVFGQIRNRGVRGMLSALRSLSGKTVTVAIENENGRPLGTPLMLAACLTRCRSVAVLWPDGTHEAVPRWRMIPMLWGMIRAQAASRMALRRAQRTAAHLSGPTGRFRVAPDAEHALFLDANLSLGIASGGSVGHVRGVIDGLVRAGVPVDYASIKPMPTEIEGARWIEPPAPGMLAFPAELNYYTHHAAFDRQMDGVIARGDYRFLYQRQSLHNISGAVLADRHGLPLVVEYNGSEAWTAANWGTRLSLHDAAEAAEHTMLRRADMVVTVSTPLRDEVEALGVPGERIVTYPNCIDPAIFAPERFPGSNRTALRDRLGIPAGRRIATFIGTFGAWHGVDFLARAIRRLIDEDPAYISAQNLHFLLIGDGLKMKEVREAVGDAPHAGRVTLTGLIPQAEAPLYLAASDIFLSPHTPTPDGSRFFGSPTKLFEYMAMGRPIVASSLDQIGEVLRGMGPDGAAAPAKEPLAALFEPGDEDGFLAALRKVLDDPDGATAMAARAKAEALGRYTWDHHVGAILEGMARLSLR